MASLNFIEMFENLESMGMLDALLPFLLVFTVSFAVLQKAKIFGEDSRKFNIIIALVLGMVVVLPHLMGSYPEGSDVVNIINNSLPNVALVLVGIIMVMVLTGIFGFKAESVGSWVFWLAVIVVIYIFLNSTGTLSGRVTSFLNSVDSTTLSVLLVLLVFGIIIFAVTSEGGKSNFGKMFDFLNMRK